MQTNNSIQKITRTKQSRFEGVNSVNNPTRKCKKSIRLERKQARKNKHFQTEGGV